MWEIPQWVKENLKYENLPEDYRALADIIGFENAIRLGYFYGGIPLNLKKMDSILAPIRNDLIRKEFNGKNHNELARKYKLTTRWIYDIVSYAPRRGRKET